MNTEEKRLLIEAGRLAARAQIAEAKLDTIEHLCQGVIARTGVAPDLVQDIRSVIRGEAS